MAHDELRGALVERLVARRTARSPSVVHAFAETPRHLFLPGVPPEVAYADRSLALVVEDGVTLSSASQPSMIAEMLEQLDVQPGERILEIGTGSGYNAALLARLCGPHGSVVTIDFDATLAGRARDTLQAAGFENILVLHGDGANGAPARAPFDRIVLTVAADDVVDPWRLQLAPGGRLVLPLTVRALQESIAFEGHDPLRSVSIVGANFVALRGSSAIVSQEIEINSSPAIRLRAGDAAAIDGATIERHLKKAEKIVTLDGVGVEDLWGGFDLWLDAHARESAVAMATGAGTGARVDDWLSVTKEEPRFAMTLALARADAVAFFIRAGRSHVHLATYGDAAALVDVARDAIARWTQRGRPHNRALAISAHVQTLPAPNADACIEKASVRLALRWN